MRKSASKGEISVQAVAGTYTVLLGMDATPRGARDLLGFSIHREDHTENEAYWLRGMLTFPQSDYKAEDYSVYEFPIQDFKWGDYTAKPDHTYTYSIYPVYGSPKKLIHGKPVEVRVTTESESTGVHGLFFNRGAAASQAFARKFGDPKMSELQKPGNPMLKWLSRGLEEAMIAYIRQAEGRGWSLHCSLFEFTYMPVLAELAAAARRGVEVRLVIDDKECAAENKQPIAQAGLAQHVIPRKAPGIALSHNKFMVLLKDGKPLQVWTGSTNITEGGIFGQSNMAQVIRDPKTAAAYHDYWTRISANPARRDFSQWNDAGTPVDCASKTPPKIEPIFSPRGSLAALECYASLMDQAKSGVFLTEAFGICDQFAEVLMKRKKYLRYILMDSPGQKSNRDNADRVRSLPLNRVAVGALIKGGTLAQWHEENLTGFNVHVRYIHTKYMLVDPLGDNPTVINGSANFSEASTESNDENMVIVRGDRRVADIFLGEFMRLFSHFYFRDKVNQAAAASPEKGKSDGKVAARTGQPEGKVPRKLFLAPDDSWTRKYYQAGSARELERLYFSGKSSPRG